MQLVEGDAHALGVALLLRSLLPAHLVLVGLGEVARRVARSVELVQALEDDSLLVAPFHLASRGLGGAGESVAARDWAFHHVPGADHLLLGAQHSQRRGNALLVMRWHLLSCS